jgi:hypothetical protein
VLADFMLGVFFDREDGDDMALRNFSGLLTDYMVLYPKDNTFFVKVKCVNKALFKSEIFWVLTPRNPTFRRNI